MQEIQAERQQAQQAQMAQQGAENQINMLKTPINDPSKNPGLAAQLAPEE